MGPKALITYGDSQFSVHQRHNLKSCKYVRDAKEDEVKDAQSVE